jgi:hypothetical protein
MIKPWMLTAREILYDPIEDQKRYLALSLREIEESEFDYFLSVLPPLAWQVRQGIEIFSLSEFTTGDVTQQFARIRIPFSYDRKMRCFSKYVNYYDKDTWITPAMIAMHDAQYFQAYEEHNKCMYQHMLEVLFSV